MYVVSQPSLAGVKGLCLLLDSGIVMHGVLLYIHWLELLTAVFSFYLTLYRARPWDSGIGYVLSLLF